MLPLRQAARDLDFAYQPSTDKRQVLTLASRHPVGHCDDWIVLRPLRVGKMHLAVLLPVDASVPGDRVLFTSAAQLIATLSKTLAEGPLGDELRLDAPPQLLIIDEIRYLPVDCIGATPSRQCPRGREEQLRMPEAGIEGNLTA